jgi:predicted nucleic acid-binding protein
MSVLVDTNVLLRRTQPTHQLYTVAVESVARLLSMGEPVYFTLQNISEFWNVVTRPVASNGLGFTSALALAEVGKIERILTLLPDAPATYSEWKHLVVQHGVIGSKVHDARLVAAMNVHGVHRILTFNTSDFTRYGIEVLHPTSLTSSPANHSAPGQ